MGAGLRNVAHIRWGDWVRLKSGGPIGLVTDLDISFPRNAPAIWDERSTGLIEVYYPGDVADAISVLPRAMFHLVERGHVWDITHGHSADWKGWKP
jgi:hypothetical protein